MLHFRFHENLDLALAMPPPYREDLLTDLKKMKAEIDQANVDVVSDLWLNDYDKSVMVQAGSGQQLLNGNTYGYSYIVY